MAYEDPVVGAKKTLERTKPLADFARKNRMIYTKAPKAPARPAEKPTASAEQPRSMKSNVALRRSMTRGKR